MYRRRTPLLVATLAIILVMTFCGCTERVLDFTVISSKNTEMKVPDAAKGQRVEGKDSVPVFLFPLGTPSVKEAVDRAIESAGPGYDALIDGVISYRFAYFIVGTVEYIVKGTPIKSQQINVSRGSGSNELIASSTPILYHSRTGKSNDEAVGKIGIARVD